MRGFGLDGKFFRGLTKAGDFLILGLITVIFCIPVITIGASLTAAFYAGMKLVKDEENYVFKDFWKSFKTNFVQGLLVELIMGVIGLLLFFDIRACAYWAFSSGSMAGTIFMYAIAGCALVWAGVLLYSFAVLSRYDDKAITIVKNSLILCVHHLPQTFIMMIATYGLILFSLKYFTLSSFSFSILSILIFSFSSSVTKCDAANIETVFLSFRICPVTVSTSLIRSISSPNHSINKPLVLSFAGIISRESPLTLKVPLFKSKSFLSYNISTSFFNTSSLGVVSPTLRVNIFFLYSSTSPIPYIHDTEATTMTSFLDIKLDVALCLNSSISSFIDESFSI